MILQGLEIKYIARGEKPMSMAYDPFFEEFIRESFHPQYKKVLLATNE
jgi:hypothetical protein